MAKAEPSLPAWACRDRVRSDFDIRRAFRRPETIRRLIGPDPRIIDQIFWAKLLQAGLSLTDDDVLSTGHNYPAAMVRAVAIVWLFCGIRRDEIRRLRVGCVQRQTRDMGVPASTEVLAKDSVVFLSVPPNKTTPAYNKPVDPVVAEVVEAWEQLRPTQPTMLDAKAAEVVQHLFAHRGRLRGMAFLNATLIPLLCRKAGVPEADARGKLTSHRARSTIGSMLGNAKQPMTLLELQQWLGHRWPSTTQHYFQILPTKLGRAYADADYFGRNVRTVDVLIDEQTILSGAAARVSPGSTSIWGMDYAPILSTSSACIAWPVHAARSIGPSLQRSRRTRRRWRICGT